MISVDIETSGVDPEVNSILSIGAVDMGNPENRYYGECKSWKGSIVENEALKVNGFTRDQIYNQEMSEAELLLDFFRWTKTLKAEAKLCGYNAHFDHSFLKSGSKRADIRNVFGYRFVDVHSVMWLYIMQNGARPPKNLSLNRSLEAVGAGREPDPHNALTGAMCAAEVISRVLTGKTMFPGEFENITE